MVPPCTSAVHGLLRRESNSHCGEQRWQTRPTRRGGIWILPATRTANHDSHNNNNNNNLNPSPSPQQLALIQTTSQQQSQGKHENQHETAIRSLDQYWWPVAAISALDDTKPNPVQVLGQPLVLFKTHSNQHGTHPNRHTQHEWSCLQDACSHRFGPLSQGTIVRTVDTDELQLQCRNHKLTFDGSGVCRHVPEFQDKTCADVRGVPSYPCQTAAGMVWVYTGIYDQEDTCVSSSLSPYSMDLPISSTVQTWYEQFGDDACFVRDLNCGMELLLEHFLDPSCLPFSYHGLAGLDRSQVDTNIPLELRMDITPDTLRRQWEQRQSIQPLYGPPPSPPSSSFASHEDGLGTSSAALLPFPPLFQASVVNASLADPVFRSMNMDIPTTASSTLAFYAPNHIAIRRNRKTGRASSQELFLCPLERGKTRVFLFHTFEQVLWDEQNKATRNQSPMRTWIEWFVPALQRNILNPTSARYHRFVNSILDRSVVIPHQQQAYRRRQSFRDYSTPSSADVMVKAVAAYLEKAIELTMANPRKVSLANSVLSSDLPEHLQRPILLDRQSHTKQCRVCQIALKETQRLHRRLEMLQPALIGTIGASSGLAVLAAFTTNVTVFRVVVASTVAAILALVGVSRWKQHVVAQLQSFFFEHVSRAGP
jgi:phenylpropionate dioxygenase-like ring-hydroxylating dioxygenase large terminal subunit